MHLAFTIAFLLLAAVDVGLIMQWHRRRSRRAGLQRMRRSLQLHVQSQLAPDMVVAPSEERHLFLRAS